MRVVKILLPEDDISFIAQSTHSGLWQELENSHVCAITLVPSTSIPLSDDEVPSIDAAAVLWGSAQAAPNLFRAIVSKEATKLGLLSCGWAGTDGPFFESLRCQRGNLGLRRKGAT